MHEPIVKVLYVTPEDKVVDKGFINISLYISKISRSLLMELSRHRVHSLSVRSSRYTLKELKSEEPFTITDKERANKFIKLTGNELVDNCSILALENLRQVIVSGVSNDIAKFCMPECYFTELITSFNLEQLSNFIMLRTNKSALWEIRTLAYAIYNVLPTPVRSQLQHLVYKGNNNE